MSAVEHIRVGGDDDGARLDRWFKRHYPDVNFGALAKACRKGQVRVNGKRADPGTRLEAGAEIRVPPFSAAPAPSKKAERVDLSPEDVAWVQSMVIYKDEKVIALNKPAGLPTQGGPGIDRHLDMLLDGLMFEREERPRLVHRLDKDTSGVILLGRSAGAAAALAKSFRSRTARKIYWALVVGAPEHPAGTIRMKIDKRPGPGGEKMFAAEDGKSSVTDYQTVEAIAGKCAWLALSPRTGRTHQLRVHCQEGLHTPIVGDGKYGGAEAFLTGGVSRKMHLHARHIDIENPSGGALRLTAPLPPHMAESWALFGFDEAEGDALNARDKWKPGSK